MRGALRVGGWSGTLKGSLVVGSEGFARYAEVCGGGEGGVGVGVLSVFEVMVGVCLSDLFSILFTTKKQVS